MPPGGWVAYLSPVYSLFFMACTPSSWGMLVYIAFTSIVGLGLGLGLGPCSMANCMAFYGYKMAKRHTTWL